MGYESNYLGRWAGDRQVYGSGITSWFNDVCEDILASDALDIGRAWCRMRQALSQSGLGRLAAAFRLRLVWRDHQHFAHLL